MSYVGAEQMTVGEMIVALNAFADLPVVLQGGGVPGDLSSYRGYYEDLAIELGESPGRHAKPLTAGEFAVALDRVSAITGYKGGSFSVGYGTAVWVSEWGSCSGDYVSAVVARDGKCVIETKREEW